MAPGWKRTVSLLVAGLLTATVAPLGAPPAAATTSGALPSYNDQTVYAYTEDGGTLDVSATFLESPDFKKSTWKKSQLQSAVIEITDPAKKVTVVKKAFDGTETVTVSKSGLASSDGKGGVWRIRFISYDSAGKQAATTGAAAKNAQVSVKPWKVEPKQGGVVKSGRVWMTALRAFQDRATDLNKPATLSVYNLSDTGVLYKNTYRGFMGIASTLSTDDLGIGDANCEPTYRSWSYTSSGMKRATNCPGATQYRLFLERPDTSMPATARSYAGGTTWVNPVYRDAQVTEPVLAQAAKPYFAGVISSTVQHQKGTLKFQIDTNNNGVFTDSVDRELVAGDVDAGKSGSVTWDGKDGAGKTVDRRDHNIRIRAVLSNIGEIHFVRQDVEISSGGIELEQVVGPEVGSKSLSWSDTALGTKCLKYDGDTGGTTSVTCTGAATSPKAANRVDSTGGVHKWTTSDESQQGSWGDSRYIDDWTTYSDEAARISVVAAAPVLARLTITKTDGVEVAGPGQELTYTMTMTNTDDVFDEPSATVVDYLPSEVEFVTSSNGGVYDEDSHTVTWAKVTIPAAGTATRTVTVKVEDAVARPGVITNFATVKGLSDPVPTTDPASNCPADVCAADSDQVPAANLVISKTNGQDRVEAGDEVTWTITVRNDGQVDEVAATVVDVLPEGIEFVDASGEPDVDTTNGTLTWTGLRVPKDDTVTLTVTGKVPADFARPSTVKNVAFVHVPGEEVPQPEVSCEEPRCASDTDPADLADLAIHKVTESVGMYAGGTVVWRIDVTNRSTTQRARAVVVAEQMPDAVDPASVEVKESSGGTWDANTNTWAVGTLAPEDAAHIVLAGKLDGSKLAADREIVNTARVSSIDDPDKGDPAADCVVEDDLESDTDGCDVATLVPETGLRVSKTDGLTEVRDGDEVTYEVTVRNTGSVTEAEMVVRDVLPAAVTFVEASDEGVYDEKAHTVTWAAVPIGPGQELTRTVTVTVDQLAAGQKQVVNYAVVGTERDGDTALQVPASCDGPSCASDTDEVVVVAPKPAPAIPSGIPGGGGTNLTMLAGGILLAGAAIGSCVWLAFRRRGPAPRRAV